MPRRTPDKPEPAKTVPPAEAIKAVQEALSRALMDVTMDDDGVVTLAIDGSVDLDALNFVLGIDEPPRS